MLIDNVHGVCANKAPQVCYWSEANKRSELLLKTNTFTHIVYG